MTTRGLRPVRRAHYRRRLALFCALQIALCAAAEACAQEMVFQLEPAQSSVHFTLPASFHTVHGTFQFKSGVIRLNPATGEAGGALVVDAASGSSGNKGRDRRMHQQILEDQKYPEIVFVPQHFSGTPAPEGTSQVELQGVMTLHGQQHPMTFTLPVQANHGQVSADVNFTVPYTQWGLKNPSTFLLRVSDKVSVEVHAAGHLTPSSVASRPSSEP